MTNTLDVSQLRCPRSLIEVKLALRQLQKGDSLKVIGVSEQLHQDLLKIQSSWQLTLEFITPAQLIITT